MNEEQNRGKRFGGERTLRDLRSDKKGAYPAPFLLAIFIAILISSIVQSCFARLTNRVSSFKY